MRAASATPKLARGAPAPLARAVCAAALALSTTGAGCSSSTSSVVRVQTTSGLEASPFAADSGVVRVELRTRDLVGAETVVATAKPEDLSLEVPDAARAGIGSLVLAGVGADGSELAYGRTPALDRTGLDSFTPTLFVQRPGLARALTLPATSSAATSVRASMLGVRYLALGDAASKDLTLYDLLAQKAAATTDALDAPPSAALMTAGAFLVAIGADGATSSLDFDGEVRAQPSLPAGLTAADVVGGRVILGDDGAAYLVGATRASGATDRVLRLASDGTLSARTLASKRAGAIAVWIDGRGLAVVGGSGDPGSAGVELLGAGAAVSVPLPWATDATAGAVGVLVEPQVLLRARADGALERLDLACAAGCAPTAASAKLGGASRDGAPLERGGALFLGVDGSLSRVDAPGTTATGLGAATTATTLVPLPTGQVAVLGSADGVLRTVR